MTRLVLAAAAVAAVVVEGQQERQQGAILRRRFQSFEGQQEDGGAPGGGQVSFFTNVCLLFPSLFTKLFSKFANFLTGGRGRLFLLRAAQLQRRPFPQQGNCALLLESMRCRHARKCTKHAAHQAPSGQTESPQKTKLRALIYDVYLSHKYIWEPWGLTSIFHYIN